MRGASRHWLSSIPQRDRKSVPSRNGANWFSKRTSGYRVTEAAQATIQALGLTNVRIRQGSISEIDDEWGRFDHIICHGVFSCVGPDVQRAILRVAHDNLTEHGVAYVSYNTYPGWHMRESVRHMMRITPGGSMTFQISGRQGSTSTSDAMKPRTSTSYDLVPYPSLAFPETHPDNLATVARIFGLRTPDVASCRVLELGCASGGNLIPMAFNLPGSEFVGIDLSRHQVDDGLATVGALNLTNVRIEHASILDVDREWGQFDYIICHGVFSWVERLVQDKILEICGGNLTAAGVAYISYNTYPGWHMRESVRHMMRYHTVQFDDPAEQVEQARALLMFLASASDSSSPYGELLTREVDLLSKATDSYLYHEHLEQTNVPLYFHDFADRAERAGLQYLSEAVVSEMLTSHFPAEIAETLERISPDILHLEQYMDFVRNRQFRRTLLCHKEQKPKRALTPAFLHGLMVSSAATCDAMPDDLSVSTSVVFMNGTQRATVSLPASKAAFSILLETWPRAVAVEPLCEAALDRAAPFLGKATAEETRRSLMGDLFGAVMYGLVGLHTNPPSCTNRPSNRPRACRLAAYQAMRSNVVVNAHHNTVGFEPFSIEVLRMADGQRRPQDMVDVLLDRHTKGELTIEENGRPITTPDAVRRFIGDRVEKVVTSLTRSAVLVE